MVLGISQWTIQQKMKPTVACIIGEETCYLMGCFFRLASSDILYVPQTGEYNFLCTSCTALAEMRGARCSSVVRAFTHGAMGHRIDSS